MIEIRPPFGLQADKTTGSLTGSHRLPALLRNEIVQGKVIHVMTDQDAVIAIKNRNVIAKSHVPLERDQVLLLRVEQTSPTPLLRLLGSAGRSPEVALLMQAVEQNPWRQILESLGRPKDAAGEQALLRNLLKDLSSLLLKPPHRELLREWIEKSGMSLESRLRALSLQEGQTPDEVNRHVSQDLKGLLARMTNKEEGQLPVMERLYNFIESLQWFNHGSLNQAGKLFLLLPCQSPEGFWTVAQLLIQKEQEKPSTGQRNARTCRVVFLAEFSSLGWVRAEMMVEGKEVHMEFIAASAESTNRLQAQLPVLIENLKGQGFRVSEARVNTLDPDLLKHSMVQELTGVGAHSFSTFV